MQERPKLGGTDGFRGLATDEVGPGVINPETFRDATHVLIERQLEVGENGPVVVIRDTRQSGVRLATAVIEGALAHPGVEVWDLGMGPTPMAQKVSQEHGASATVAITASHNDRRYNGWKGMPGSRKPSKDEVNAMSDRYWQRNDQGLVVPRSQRRAQDKSEMAAWYAQEVVNSIEKEFGEQPLKGALFVVDGANGAGKDVTPHIFRRLGATVETFACDGKGEINDGCGAASLGGLKQYLERNPNILRDPRFIGAVANDGDADRMMGIGLTTKPDGAQELVEINGNHVMAALAEGEPGIVGTEYTNTALVRRLQEQKIGFEHCANGDVFVTQRLRELQAEGKDWRRGGEFTGHHVDLDWLSSGDGVRMAAWFAAHTLQKRQTFGDVHQDLPLWTEEMTKVEFSDLQRNIILEDEGIQAAIANAKERAGENGRLIVRPSGTEPVLRIWGESLDASNISQIVKGLARVIHGRLAA